MQTLEGLFAPLATAFTDDALSLSEIRFARQLQYLLTQPVDGFIACSDVGEFTTLAQSERKQVVEWTARSCSGKPFLVHVSALSTSSSLDLAQHASRHGARGGVLMMPFYGTLTADEQIGFVRTVAQYSNLPIIVVDPAAVVTEEVREGLKDLPELSFASPLSHSFANISCSKGLTYSDEFKLSNCFVTPLALLRPKQVKSCMGGEATDLAKLIILEETLGRARVSKAGLEALGIEIGPPRPPIRALSGAVGVALKTLLQI